MNKCSPLFRCFGFLSMEKLTRTPLTLIVITLAVFALSACGSKKDDIEESGKPLSLEKVELKKAKFKKLWSRSVGNGQGKRYNQLSLDFDGSDVFAASVNGRVTRYNKSGKKVWSTKIKETLSAGVGVGSGLALVATRDGVLIALASDTGLEKWRKDMRGEVLASPQAWKGRVVVQTYDGRLIGLNRDSGEELWSYVADLPLLTLRGTATPKIVDGIVYTGFANGKVVALDSQTGVLIWDKAVALAKGQAEIDRVVDVDATPLVTGNFVYAASFNGNLFAFDRRRGNARWRFETSTYRELAEGFGKVYLVDEKSRMYGLDADDGAQRWEQSALLNRQLGSPVNFNGFLVVADYKGFLHAISQVNGSIVGRTRVDRAGVRVPMRSVGSQLYVYSDDGKLAAYQLENL